MRNYILRRLLYLIPILLAVSFLTFLLIYLSPGDYLTRLYMDPTISPERIEQLRTQFGLNKPWYVQYGLWLYNLTPYKFPFGLKLPDPGYSFQTGMPVLTLMTERFVNTLILAVSAECVIWLVTIPLALFLASKKYSWIDQAVSGFLFTGISFPQVLLALLALLVAARTGWFPIGGMHQLGYENLSFFKQTLDLMHHLLLPVIVLSFGEMLILTRYARASLLEVETKDFVLTARAKGLSEKQVLRVHALKNSLNPLLTLFGFSFANLISGSFVVEIIMGWPGVGRLAYDAMLAEDLYVLMASLLAGTVFLVTGNLVSDILLAFNDPRIRYD